jgi:soluble lytic murein transglycosylase-like protein
MAAVRHHSRRRLAAVVAAVFVVGLGIGILLAPHEQPPLAPGRGPAGDPLAWRPGEDRTFEERAAAGESHVLYAKSPGGAVASARRVARWRPLVEAAARRHGVAPDDLEALVFLESAGRPDACASRDLAGACGLTQILAGTATNLLGMRVDLAASRRLTRRIARAHGRRAARPRARRRHVDQRFDPRRAVDGAGRYLQLARSRLGRGDLALESYHMGIGNLQGVLRAYRERRIPYARLYFDSTPLRHASAYRRLAAFGDDSATYLWRLYAARTIMRLSREDPAALARLAFLHGRKASAEEVLHPRSGTPVFATPAALLRARAGKELLPLPADAPALHFRVDRRMGELARRLGRPRSLYRALRPEALAMLVYIAAGTHEIAGAGALNVTSTVRDESYQRLLVRQNGEATRAYSLHTTGFAFDVERRYRSRRQALAFQFMLDRLQALDMIAYAVEPRAIHITVSSDARVLTPLLAR